THLARLVSGGLLTVTKTGRHRYYSLSSKQVAQALETLALIAPAQPVRSLRQSLEAQAICRARTCYDHLAGTLGVQITEAMLKQQILDLCGEALALTPTGLAWFA